ncbi:MAG: Transcriptional regulator, DeoR family, partial [uncultured Thermomicrobiales bacterium]
EPHRPPDRLDPLPPWRQTHRRRPRRALRSLAADDPARRGRALRGRRANRRAAGAGRRVRPRRGVPVAAAAFLGGGGDRAPAGAAGARRYGRFALRGRAADGRGEAARRAAAGGAGGGGRATAHPRRRPFGSGPRRRGGRGGAGGDRRRGVAADRLPVAAAFRRANHLAAPTGRPGRAMVLPRGLLGCGRGAELPGRPDRGGGADPGPARRGRRDRRRRGTAPRIRPPRPPRDPGSFDLSGCPTRRSVRPPRPGPDRGRRRGLGTASALPPGRVGLLRPGGPRPRRGGRSDRAAGVPGAGRGPRPRDRRTVRRAGGLV